MARILVVDDEPKIRSLIRTLLTRQGYEILEASDGVEALSLCNRGPSPDLLLTDVVMPRMDGVQLAERVATLYPSVRVLYMSGKCEVESIQTRLRKRKFGFIRKPFEIEALGEAVRKRLRPGPGRVKKGVGGASASQA
jgi:two-component system cell cycle sensor histidine kinase/response regulator CckA